MSGIEDIKKKTKMSIDEMYEDQSVGKLDNQKSGHPYKQQVGQTTIKPDKNIVENQTNQKDEGFRRSFNNELDGKEDLQEKGQKETRLVDNVVRFSARQAQPQKALTYKMTFILTEEIYKAFNDLYAQRMLKGRKSEKSVMICEAIEWLIKMEDKAESS